MKKIWIILLVIGLIVVGSIGWYINGLNTVVILDEKVKQAWAQIDNQLQRRNDLIPNLVSTVQGYAAHEKGIFENIAKLRSQWSESKTIDQKMESANDMTSAISRLLLVVENYPQLKADQNFLALQAQLEGTENRIAVERMRYNEDVKIFNSYIRTVFGSFFASMRQLNKPAVYFEIKDEAKTVPVVKF